MRRGILQLFLIVAVVASGQTSMLASVGAYAPAPGVAAQEVAPTATPGGTTDTKAAGTDGTAVDYSQCANDPSPSTSTACPGGWINGILNVNKSHYSEDEVTPQRMVIDLPANGPTTNRTTTIRWETRKGDIHAYDLLATWNYTQSSADRCQGLAASDCPSGSASTFAIPDDPTLVPRRHRPGHHPHLGPHDSRRSRATVDHVWRHHHRHLGPQS